MEAGARTPLYRTVCLRGLGSMIADAVAVLVGEPGAGAAAPLSGVIADAVAVLVHEGAAAASGALARGASIADAVAVFIHEAATTLGGGGDGVALVALHQRLVGGLRRHAVLDGGAARSEGERRQSDGQGG